MDGNLKPRAPPVRVGSYPEGIAITRDGRKAYVANWFSDDISVIDLVFGKGNPPHQMRARCRGGTFPGY